MKYLINKKVIPFMFLLDIVIYILFFWRKFRRKPKNIRKVLFVRLEHIGDMVMATPVFESFKKSNPETEVHVLCKRLTSPLIKNNPNVDKIIEYDAPWFIQRDIKTNKNFISLIKELRKEKYDLVFEMHGDPRNNFIALLSGAYSIGYSCRGFGALLNKTEYYNNQIHMIKQNLNLIKDYTRFKTEKTVIFTDNSAKKTAARILKKNGLQEKHYVIINPFSGRAEKDLTNAEITKFIKKNIKIKILLTGAKSEYQKNKVYEKFPNIINISGETDLLTLVELVRMAKKVIAPDTGIIHIAYATGTPFHAVYKTTDRKIWGYDS